MHASKLFLILCLLTLVSCSTPSKFEGDPAKIGYGRDDLKQSPCACVKIYSAREIHS